MITRETYTIKQTAELTGITQDTIRYYEKIGLLPRAERKENGHREYRQEAISTIQLISCLKKTGMPLEEMKPFLTVNTDSDPADFPELVERLIQHRENIVSQMDALQQVVDFIDMKLDQGKMRKDCTVDQGNGFTGESGGKSVGPKVSPAEMRYFTGTARVEKSS